MHEVRPNYRLRFCQFGIFKSVFSLDKLKTPFISVLTHITHVLLIGPVSGVGTENGKIL